MTTGRLNGVLAQLRRLVAAEGGGARPDRDLLESFVRDHDEAAFAALVRRHGPMVLAVCRRVLRHEQDAEDACQAAFLVLARKAASIRKHAAVGCWLHGVAYRAASNLRRSVARRRGREQPLADEARAADADVTWREVRTVLDEELRRLPARFQAPLLLCYLEGKTRDEAAQELGWSPGTLRGRLERGRDLLRARLARRGLALSAGLFGALLAERAPAAVLPATAVVRMVRAAALTAAGKTTAAGLVSAEAAALAEGVLQTMALSKLKIAAVVFVGLGIAGLGAGAWIDRTFTVAQAAAGLAAGVDDVVGAGKLAGIDQPGPRPDLQARARNQALSRLNLKHLALAMHNYCDVTGHFPAPAYYQGMRQEGGQGGGPMAGMMGRMGGGMAAGEMPGGPGGAARPGMMRGAPGMPGMGMGRMMPGRGGPPGMPGGAPAAGMMPPGGQGLPPVDSGSGIPAITGKDGKALLSWRVAILPYLGQAEAELYKQFRLDEPWDGPHNKPLLKKMPKVFARPGGKAREPYTTFYQVFVGPRAAFEKRRWVRMMDILDGTANTILIAEAGQAVPWTKPEDLHFAPDEPLPELGGLFLNVINAAFADGKVYALRKNADSALLRAAITRDGGEVSDLNRIKAPASRLEAELRRKNELLKQEIQHQRAQLEELRCEQELLREMAGTYATVNLRNENEQLEQFLREMQNQIKAMHEEIRHLKKD